MALRGHELINGAGRTGLMGAVTDSIMHDGGRAVGVIPQFMVDRGWQHPGMSELIVTTDMHSRKDTMARLSDACIAMPGGVGTLEELLEIITWKQLGLYVRPIVVLNLNHYFDPPAPDAPAGCRPAFHAPRTYPPLGGGEEARRGPRPVRKHAPLEQSAGQIRRSLKKLLTSHLEIL